MKAAVRHEYGPPEIVNLEEVPTPIPTEDEVLVRVHAASVNLGDWEMLTGDPLFVSVLANLFTRKPRYDVTPPNGAATWKGGFPKVKFKILGTDIAGKVEAVGGNVTQFQPGDEVFGMCLFGAFAEYVCVSQKASLVPKPASMTFEQAAAIPQAAFIAPTRSVKPGMPSVVWERSSQKGKSS